jgi:hypothetical protein
MDATWVLAREEAAGRGAVGAPLPDDVRGLARRLVEVGRRVEALPPCPAAALRRAIAIADGVPRGVAARLWALLFDSAGRAAPVLRGGTTTRLLRYGGEGGSIDLEVARVATGGLRLSGTVDVAGEGLSLDVAVVGARTVRVPVRAGGLFDAEILPARGAVSLTLRAGRRVLARLPALPPVA